MNISLSPEIIFSIGSFQITNTVLWSFFLSIFLIFLIVLINKNIKYVPNKMQGFLEVLFLGAYSFVKNVVADDKKAKKMFPLIFTMFIFILVANLATYIPGQAAVSLYKENDNVPLFRAVMSDYGMVFILTMITIILSQVVLIVSNGPFGYLNKFINLNAIKNSFLIIFKKDLKFGEKIGGFFQGFLDFFLGIMDLVGEISKVVSLSFRLFGNIFAGEVLTAVMLFLAPFFVPLPFMFLGLLTAFVQAFVFSVLTLIFVTMASETKEV